MHEQKQIHSINHEKRQQEHTITVGYLDRAIDTKQPLQYRIQVLRFLVVALEGAPIQQWAKDELATLESSNQSIVKLMKELSVTKSMHAKVVSEVALLTQNLESLENAEGNNKQIISSLKNDLDEFEQELVRSTSEEQKLKEQLVALKSKHLDNSQQELQNEKINNQEKTVKSTSIFLEFLGFKIDDSEDVIVAKLGNPQKLESDNNGWGHYRYFNNGLVISVLRKVNSTCNCNS